MKTKMRKLVLGRETLLKLEESEALEVAAGAQTARTVCATRCITGCPTCTLSEIPCP